MAEPRLRRGLLLKLGHSPPNGRNTLLARRRLHCCLICHNLWLLLFKQKPWQLCLQSSPKECGRRLTSWNPSSTYHRRPHLRHCWVIPTRLYPSLLCLCHQRRWHPYILQHLGWLGPKPNNQPSPPHLLQQCLHHSNQRLLLRALKRKPR